jgi:sulfatase maturation enzyme AslB (radical SAM superfamily)
MIGNPNTVSVTYNTNGSFLLSEAVIMLLKKFKQIDFILSIDGYAELNDQVRGGSSWNDVLAFIDQIKSLNFGLTIHTVIHKNNWHGLTELSKFVKIIDRPWTTNILTYPHHLDISTLEDKKPITDLINSLEIPNKEYIIKHLNYENLNT